MGITVQRNLNFYNVKGYTAQGNGTTDDTAAITAAINAAVAAGGGVVFFPAGTYLSTNQTLAANVTLRGSGIGATIIKLKAGANTDLFSGQTGSINISAAANTGSAGTLLSFGLSDMTLDGNKANQTSGTSYPLRFYGYNFTVRNIEILNGYTGGYLSDWNGGGFIGSGDEMESLVDNCKFHDNNGIGFQYSGPHDSRLTNLLSFSNGSHSFHLTPNANGMQVESCHGYLPPNVTGTCAWLIESSFGSYFTNCEGEGSYFCNVALLGADFSWIGGKVFGGAATSATVTAFQLGQQAGQTPFPGQVNQSAGVTTAILTSGAFIVTNITQCKNGTINYANESSNTLLLNIFLSSGTSATGTPSTTDQYIINVNGLTSDGTFAKSGGVQFRHNTSTNTQMALGPTSDGRNALVLYPNSGTQSVPLLKIQNESQVDKFTADKNGNVTASGIITPSGGLAPVHTGFTGFSTGGAANLLNASSGAVQATVAGSVYWAALWIPFNVLLTGIILTAGTTGGTDLWIVALYDNAGNIVANSALAGTTAGASAQKTRYAFTAQATVLGPSVYYIALQSNGTTANFRGFNNGTEGFVTGSVAGTFGTLPNPLTPGTTYTPNIGPFATTY